MTWIQMKAFVSTPGESNLFGSCRVLYFLLCRLILALLSSFVIYSGQVEIHFVVFFEVRVPADSRLKNTHVNETVLEGSSYRLIFCQFNQAVYSLKINSTRQHRSVVLNGCL